MQRIFILCILYFYLNIGNCDEDLPFHTDNFDDTSVLTNTEDPIKNRLKMEMKTNNNNGPPGIGSDIFDQKTIDENIRLASVASLYEGSAEAVESNESESDEIPEPLENNNSTQQIDQTIEYSSNNSSLLFDQNTSDSSDDEKEPENAANVLVEDEDLESDPAKNETIHSAEKLLKNLGVENENSKTMDGSESSKFCPPPRICAPNCFVSINEKGCQDCQCLWESANCETDEDCNQSNNQFCDLGKCNCKNGFRQNMKKSGHCEVDPVLLVKSYDFRTVDFDTTRRSKRATKPRRSERLEWPGVCDKNEQCPQNLVCIHGDCWSLPNRPETLIVSGSAKRTTTGTHSRTWFPPTTTTIQPTEQPLDIPVTVDRFVMIETTTPNYVLNDNKFENLQQRKDNFLGDFGDEWNEIDQSHVKKIHLETDPPPLVNEKRKKKKKPRKIRKTTPIPPAVNEIEFPISSKMRKNSKRPKALSAEPTREELKDHKKLMEIFNLHELESFNEELTTFPVPTTTTTEPNFDYSLETTTEPFEFPSIPPLETLEPLESIFSKPEDIIESVEKPYLVETQKFQQIAPLQNISGDMESDDPPEVTPEPAPFEQHQIGIWYPMRKGDIPHLGIFGGELRRSPKKIIRTTDDLRLYNEYTKANRRNRPIRIEMDNAAQYIQNECITDNDCSTYHNTVCCTKKWCDRTNNCGMGKFCLPNCDATKLTFLPSTNHAEGIIDIMYD
ncbi:unnamed protein product [Caenorhabditis angaria]|uniref:EB domain-containing protein n=1 Tax=Caenorhabditis angaria TaxID=860376 RepID=A0A9P1J1V7_9PELO|nr:unnamed protein product [Caenorhabditis angaria]